MSDNRRVLVTRALPKNVHDRLVAEFDAVANPDDAVMSQNDVVSQSKGCRAIVCSPTEKMDAETISKLPDSVELIATFSVGCDHIDLNAARAHGLIICNTPDVLTDATADTTILCLLGAARMAQNAENVLREGQWGRWAPGDMLGVHMSGKRIGIVGMGRIGQATARRARGFDMTVMYHNRRKLSAQDDQGATYFEDASKMLPLCDFLALTCPLTDETKGWLNSERIAMLPDGVVIANTSRGPVIEDDALISALESGKVFAAGLDVFTNEPNLDPRYLSLPNAFVLPHIGSATKETRDAMGMRCLDNIAAHFAGAPLPSQVA